MALDMCPRPARNNRGDLAAAEFVLHHKSPYVAFPIPSALVLIAYFVDQGRGQLRAGVLSSLDAVAVLAPISPVGFPGVPTQVLEMVVARVAVCVTAFHPLGAWTDKRFENKTVGECVCHRSVPSQHNHAVPLVARALTHKPPIVGALSEIAPTVLLDGNAVQRLHAPKTRDFIKPLEPNNGLPYFTGQRLNVRSRDRLLRTVEVRSRRALQRSRLRPSYRHRRALAT